MCFPSSPKAPTNPAPVPVDESYKLVDFVPGQTRPAEQQQSQDTNTDDEET